MTTDIPDPDDDPYAFSNGLMPYDRIHDMLDETPTRREVLEERLRHENLTDAEMAELDALQRQPEPAAIHVGQGDEQT